jgi:hypothetical protein
MKAASMCQKLVLVLSIKRKVLLIKIINTKKAPAMQTKRWKIYRDMGETKKFKRIVLYPLTTISVVVLNNSKINQKTSKQFIIKNLPDVRFIFSNNLKIKIYK